MLSRSCAWPLGAALALTICRAIVAQNAPPAPDQPTDADTPYFELRRSKDRLTQQLAERYSNLVKLQEWSSKKGTKTVAKYIDHDPGFEWVMLAAVKGRGADRVLREVKVPVGQLSKTCQSRVKQIATLQTRLDELAAAAPAGDPSVAGIPPGDIGAPMSDEQGNQPASIARVSGELGPGPETNRQSGLLASGPPAAPVEGQDDPDPLGFSEVAPPPAPNGAQLNAQFIIPGPTDVAPIPTAQSVPAVAGPADPKRWRTDYPAFAKNFGLNPMSGKIDFGNLDALRIMGEATAASGDEASRQQAAELAEQLGDVQWEGRLQAIQTREPNILLTFDLPALASPLEIEFRIDSERGETLEKWKEVPAFPATERVRFKGRLAMASPTKVVVFVREPEVIQAGKIQP